MAKILKLMHDNELIMSEENTSDCNKIHQKSSDAESDDVKKRASFLWLIRRMCREARMEASLNPRHTIKVVNMLINN